MNEGERSMGYAIEVKPGKRVNLDKIDPREKGDLEKAEGKRRLKSLAKEISDLQELLYAASERSLLIVLQGMDTSGKDGVIRHALRNIEPLGCRVWSFKTPTPLELSHDFLWRIHAKVPELGMMTIFNRSHYEDVLIVRVKDLVPESAWRPRYDQINDFERLLTDSGTIVLKFFLYISKDEQEERLRDREREPEKAWKLSVDDWIERESWDDYMAAYQDVLSKCSTPDAPWYIVPADRKWFRNVAIADVIADRLRPFKDEWLQSLAERGEKERKALDKVRPAEK